MGPQTATEKFLGALALLTMAVGSYVGLVVVPADAAQGNVQTLAIGVKGGTGTFYLDSIRLYAKPAETIAPVMPDNNGLLAHYPLNGNFNDVSGSGLNGAAVGNPT